jgi:VanZ family protein
MPTVFVNRPTPASLERKGALKRFLMIWAPALAGMGIVAIESTPTFSSANTSSWLRPVIEHLFGHFTTPAWEEYHHLLRKTGHFSFYGLLCVLFMRGWLLTLARNASIRSSVWRWTSWGLGVASTFLVASADELHQTFLPSRTGLFSDVVLDTCGGLFMSSIVMGIARWIRHVRSQDAPRDAYLQA